MPTALSPVLKDGVHKVNGLDSPLPRSPRVPLNLPSSSHSHPSFPPGCQAPSIRTFSRIEELPKHLMHHEVWEGYTSTATTLQILPVFQAPSSSNSSPSLSNPQTQPSPPPNALHLRGVIPEDDSRWRQDSLPPGAGLASRPHLLYSPAGTGMDSVTSK